MTVARFKVVGRLDRANGIVSGTVLIDREAGTFSVRPKGRRRLFTLPLASVADYVVGSITTAETRQQKRRKS